MAESVTLRQAAPVRWAKVVDQTRCIGCHACSTACKSENQVPIGVHRTYVKYVDVGRFPHARRAFQVTRCNQCAEPPCVYACPTAAMYQRPDGIVDFDKRVCIGCKACIAACPYDAVFINPEDHSAEKCNFCAQRLDVGLEPACVVVCPDRGDRGGRPERRHLARVADGRPRQRRGAPAREGDAAQALLQGCPPGDTRPDRGAPAARRPVHVERAGQRSAAGHLGPSRRAEQRRRGDAGVRRGAPRALGLPRQPVHVDEGDRGGRLPGARVAAARRRAPARERAVAVGGAGRGRSVSRGDRGPADARPHASRALLPGADPPAVAELARARRRHPLALRRGAGGALPGRSPRRGAAGRRRCCGRGCRSRRSAAVYTAWLFAQAKARDLWQSPLLPPQLLVQAVASGAGALLLVAAFVEPAAVRSAGADRDARDARPPAARRGRGHDHAPDRARAPRGPRDDARPLSPLLPRGRRAAGRGPRWARSRSRRAC